VQTLQATGNVYSLAFSPDSAFLANGTADRFVYVWDVHSGRLLQKLDGHDKGVGARALSPDGTLLAA